MSEGICVKFFIFFFRWASPLYDHLSVFLTVCVFVSKLCFCPSPSHCACVSALLGVTTTQGVAKMRAHIKMLCNDLYTYKMKSEYQGGSPHCRLCYDISQDMKYDEDIEHILTVCIAYIEVR